MENGKDTEQTLVYVGFDAQFYEGGSCPGDGNYDLTFDSGWKEKRRKRLVMKHTFWGNHHYRVENYLGLAGGYKYGGLTTYKHLEW